MLSWFQAFGFKWVNVCRYAVALRDIAMKKPDGDIKLVKDELATMRAEKEREIRMRREEFDTTHSR